MKYHPRSSNLFGISGRSSCSSLPSEKGFTLLEIVVAVLILASAVTVLLGLQTSAMSRAIADANRQKALLLARRILAQIEVTEPPNKEIVTTDYATADGVMKVLFDSSGVDNETSDTALFRAAITPSDWPINDLSPKAMKRVDVTVAWGDYESDRLTVALFIPGESPNTKPAG